LLFQLQASVHGIKGNESGLWLTPTATDIGTRSEEAMKRRKKYRTSIGRTTVPPGNLAEQVQYGKPVLNMYPTPTQDSVSERTKRYKQGGLPLTMAVKMFPTPTATERSGINPKTGKGGGLNHLITVKMYPTPRASAAMTEDMETIAKRNKYNSKLEEKVALQMYPTPRANEPGRTTKGYGRALGELMEGKEQMYPTPTTRDYKDSTVSPSYQNRNSDSLPIKMMKEGKHGGKLNPEFVEFLMGYPLNWTKVETTE
jgi:hypothetical protein